MSMLQVIKHYDSLDTVWAILPSPPYAPRNNDSEESYLHSLGEWQEGQSHLWHLENPPYKTRTPAIPVP